MNKETEKGMLGLDVFSSFVDKAHFASAALIALSIIVFLLSLMGHTDPKASACVFMVTLSHAISIHFILESATSRSQFFKEMLLGSVIISVSITLIYLLYP
nr:hypothetical protein [Vibrio splendidus]MCC4881849.1 hypothetical protein [Vibrio splendidus]